MDRGAVGGGAVLRAVRWAQLDRWVPPQPVAAPEFAEGPPRPPRCREGVGGAESGLRWAGSGHGTGAGGLPRCDRVAPVGVSGHMGPYLSHATGQPREGS